jgi:hypothetical protein
MNLKDFLFNQFVLIRPYSIINIIIISILTASIGTGQLNLTSPNLILAIILATFYWICSMFFAEFLHKNIDNRKELYSNKFAIFIYLIFITFCLIFLPIGILIFSIVLISVYLYASKSKKGAFTQFLFLFRPAPEIGVIFATVALYSISLTTPNIIYFIFIVYLISISRNLIGDIRDINHDKYTLPKIIGPNKTYLISFVLLLVTSIITIFFNLFALLPLLLIGLLIITKTNSYALHRIYVTITGIYFCFFLIGFENSSLLITLLIFFNFLAYFTYNLVPREANKNKPNWL